LSNSLARKFVDNFVIVVQVCCELEPMEEQEDWMKIVKEFRTVANWLDSQEHFDFEKLAAFQLDVDMFCEAYFWKTGMDGMTNYFHLLFAGHYSYFLLKYGNLYRFSQQGWEM
jgi:hypothetical protein